MQALFWQTEAGDAKARLRSGPAALLAGQARARRAHGHDRQRPQRRHGPVPAHRQWPAGDARRSMSGERRHAGHLRPHRDASCAPACTLDLAAVDVVEQAFRALASGKVIMPPILSMDDPRRPWRGRRKDRVHPGLRRIRDQGQPRLLRQPQDRPAQPQRPDDPVLRQDRPRGGAAPRQRLSHRRAHRRGRRGGRAPSGAARGARRRACSAPASRRGCRSKPLIWCGRSPRCWSGAATAPRRRRVPLDIARRSASRPSRPIDPPPWCATASW